MRTSVALRVPDAMLKAIDAITAGRMDRPDRSAVIRELVAEALAARAKKGR
jgi:metal-responsive CopG/Arc/MetJ family transcriptional regulator